MDSSSIGYFFVVIVPLAIVGVYKLTVSLIDRSELSGGNDRNTEIENPVDPDHSDLYIRYESYNHYDEGDYR